MKSAVRNHVAAALLLFPMAAAFVAQPAQAQHRAVVAPPGIANIAVTSDAGLAPGAHLRVQVFATPGARHPVVSLGNTVRVALREQAPGNYVGTYTVKRSDRIDPRQLITARATFRGATVARSFHFPPSFQALAMGAPAAVHAAHIERFTVRPQGRLVPGRELRFRLVGARGGEAWLDIPGVIRGVDLEETRPGIYEGRYTVRRRDDLGAFDRAVATLKVGQQRVTARVDLPEPGRAHRGDQRPPQVTHVTPGHRERIDEMRRTHIVARLRDDRSGVDPASVRLRVDGVDVTQDARITPDQVSYRERLGNGRHRAELEVRDRAGNLTRTAWTFRVV